MSRNLEIGVQMFLSWTKIESGIMRRLEFRPGISPKFTVELD